MEKAVKINTETKYSTFRFIKGNRPLVPNKVKNLIKSFESGLDLFPYCPILVNQDYFVIDGQHRLEACRKLRLPVYYITIKDITLLQIAQLNATATKWKVSDFFNCFIEAGNQDYKRLQMFTEKYGINVGLGVQLLMAGQPGEGSHGVETFRQGQFVVKHEQLAEKIMKAVHDYSGCAEYSILTDRAFVKAIHVLLCSENYEHSEVVGRLQKKKSVIVKKANWKEYIYHIEEHYNKDNSKRYILYQSHKVDKSKIKA